jgi:hypothetical protein
MTKKFRRTAAFLLLSFFHPALSTALAQGGLTPPGAPASTMKTLLQIEPRTDVLTLAGNGNNQYIIIQSGSYYLTTNITGVASKNGINIQADNVRLDLNGFTLYGGVTNSQAGITVTGPHVGLVIRNGAVSGWGGNGITAGTASDSEFEHLRAMTNGNIGMKVGSGNTVANCIAIENNADGIDTGSNCTVSACEANGNDNGISTGANCRIADCEAGGNPSIGFNTGDNCRILQCVAVANADGIAGAQNCSVIGCIAVANYGAGIYTLNGCCIKDSVANTNGYGSLYSSFAIWTGDASTIIGCTANGNFGDGVDAGNGCTIKDSTADLNAYEGFSVYNDCTVIGCTAWTNNYNGFFVVSECNVINCNACANNGNGIVAGYSCLIKDNTTASNSRYVPNGGAGIFTLYSGCRIEGNNSNSDENGIEVEGTENFIIGNTVRDAFTDNYNIYSGNMVGTVVYATTSTAIQGVSGGSGLGTTDPYANFSF